MGAFAVLVALIYAWQQVKAVRQELRLGAIWEMFRELDADVTRSSRGYILLLRGAGYRSNHSSSTLEGSVTKKTINPISNTWQRGPL
jgi:hypothetical protein